VATQYTDDELPYPEVGDLSWDESIIAMILALASRSPLHSLLVLPAERPSSSLSVRILGGMYRDEAGERAEVTEQTLTLPNSSTRRVWLESDGTPAHGTTWPTDRDVVPLARVTTAGGVVSDILDVRSGWQAFGGPQPAAIANASGTLADVTTKFNTLLAALRSRGIIAT
jgi:hypothetical protein